MNICDIACNFTSDRFASDLDEVINRALKKNVKNFVLLCSELEEVNKILEIKDSYPSNIFYTYGTHPHNANTFNTNSIPLLNNLISDRRPNAIGEIGLDYFRNHSSQEEQIFAFEEQIKIALDNGLPIYLHQRDAHDDFINLLNKYKIKKKLTAEFLGRGGAWLDTGSLDDYYKTSAFVQAVENRQGLKIACLEEIALLNNWISKIEVKKQIKFYGNCEYSNYLKKIIKKSA